MSDWKRQSISLETKIKILDCRKRGERPTYVGISFGFNKATIGSIKKTRIPFENQLFLDQNLVLKHHHIFEMLS